MKSIKEELKDAAREAMARETAWPERVKIAILRGDWRRAEKDYPLTARSFEAALAAIDSYFSENLEEVEVQESLWPQDPFGRYHRLVMPDDRYAGGIWTQHVMAAHTILIRKQEPEKVEVTRETLAVLTEHYRDTPAKSNECDRAAAEADRLLKR
jgi:hypothetical protein